MNLDISALTTTMTEAVRGVVGKRWADVQDFAEPELHKLAETLEKMNRMHAEGKVNAGRAREIVQMQRNTAFSVLKTTEGLGLLTATKAIEAAARVAGAIVNRLIGFRLI